VMEGGGGEEGDRQKGTERAKGYKCM